MALQASGPISLLDVATEFGGAAPHSINEYYGKPGLPASGIISLNDFYGKANEVTLRIYPGYTGVQGLITNAANASDGDLNTYSTHDLQDSGGTGLSVSGIPPNQTLSGYDNLYVKSLRVYAKYSVVWRANTSTPVAYVTGVIRKNSDNSVVINNSHRSNSAFAYNTIIVDDATVNAAVNVKVSELKWLTYMGLDLSLSNFRISLGGYAHRSRVYEMFWELTLSGAPPV
jgi:hypothetical protein